MIFWHDKNVPDAVLQKVTAFQREWPQVELTLLNDETAVEFLDQAYGGDYADCFAACRIPAMRSDLLRLAWLAHHGGMYLDTKFAPLTFPEGMFHKKTGMIALRYPEFFNVIGNAFLLAPAGSAVAKRLMSIAFQNVRERQPGSIVELTGPGLLMDEFARCPDPENLLIVKYKKVEDVNVRADIRPATFEEMSEDHWSKRQAREPLYLDRDDVWDLGLDRT